MKNLIRVGLLTVLAGLLAACQTTSSNSVYSSTRFNSQSPTGILIFSTQSDGSENTYNRTMGITALLYDPVTQCAQNVSNDLRDSIRSGNAAPVRSAFNSAAPKRDNRSWHIHEVLPGDYVVTEIERFTGIGRSGNTTTHNYTRLQTAGAGPALPVYAGRITYAGNFTTSRSRNRAFVFSGHTMEGAQVALDEYPGISGEIEMTIPRTVPLSCVPARGDRAGDEPSTDKPPAN